MIPAIAFGGITLRYHESGRTVLDEVSFSVDKGERVALLGNNGTGKTSLLLAAAGLLQFDGVIRVNGISVTGEHLSEIRRMMGVVFSTPEDQLLFPRVIDDVAFSAGRFVSSACEATAIADNVLNNLGIAHLCNRQPHQLSHGERLAVALAGAVAGTPRVLLLDEPSTTLDPPSKLTIARALRAHPAAMLIATHDLPFAAAVCHRFLVLSGGKISLDTRDRNDLLHIWPVDIDVH